MPSALNFEDFVSVEKDPYEACKGSHSIVVLTDWEEFKYYDYCKIFQNMEKPAFIFDGRNFLNHEKLKKIGFNVYSIGKV
jgi:UDPglucose 6-dehydrogenase